MPQLETVNTAKADSSISAPTTAPLPTTSPNPPAPEINVEQAAASLSSTPKPKTEEKEEKKAPEDKLSSKFAALSRKERLVVQKQQELKAEEAKLSEIKAKNEALLAEERAAFESERKELQEFRELKKSNSFMKILDKLGVSYQQLTDQALNDGKPTPEQLLQSTREELDAKIQAITKAQEKKDLEAKSLHEKAEKEAQEKALKAKEEQEKQELESQAKVIDEFRSEIRGFTSTHSDEYELINLNDASEIVFATVEQHYEKTGKVLSIKEASDAVERFLEQQVEKNTASKKFKAKVGSASPKADTEVKPKADATPQPTKTITNDMTSMASSGLPVRNEQERINRALAALSRTG